MNKAQSSALRVLPAPEGETTTGAPALSSFAAARGALRRDLTLAFRQRGQLVQPLAFFAMVTLLFPLAVSPQLGRLPK